MTGEEATSSSSVVMKTEKAAFAASKKKKKKRHQKPVKVFTVAIFKYSSSFSFFFFKHVRG